MLAQAGEVFIDRYRVEEYVAEGGMQEVYRAQDLNFRRHVALKIPKNPSAEKRFARSARVSAKIVHPNVAKTLDYFEIDGRAHLVEEFVEGVDLSRLLKFEYNYLDPHLAAHLAHLLSKGLAASHHAGVVHRDMKPSNVMVANDPNISIVKITDFGIAKMAEEEIAEAAQGGEPSMSRSSTAMGALPYMAPEMIESPKTAGMPADIWALGAILYRVVSGEYPFGNGWSAMANIIRGKVPGQPEMLKMRPQFVALGDALWNIIEMCLQMDPTKRPTADALVQICGETSYSDAPRQLGTVDSYKPGTGKWGFLHTDAYESVFYHLESYYGEEPVLGARVNFACFPGAPRARAIPVLPRRPDPLLEE
jgi:serine/threonine-protein kinase